MNRKIALVAQQISLNTSDQAWEDLQYWLKKSPQERLAAVTFLINQTLTKKQGMDKSVTATFSIKI